MRYRVVMSNEKVGRAAMPPFEVQVPDAYGACDRAVEATRLIRDRVVDALSAIDPEPAADSRVTRALVDARTLVTADLRAGQGAVHHGGAGMTIFNLYEVD